MKVAVIEDDQTNREQLAAQLRRYAAERNAALDVSCFASVESFLFGYHFDCDLALLDIAMSGTDGIEGWDYAKEMAFPFGYGLSYTQFEQSIEPGSFAYDAETDEFSIAVNVKNVGDAAGKSVVELYVQTPYTDYDRENLVEKSAIQLVGFAKTDTLAPAGEEGDAQRVTITVDRYLLASYDTNGAAGYILDGGNYYFAVGDDAHDAMNNILAKKFEAENISPDACLPLTDQNGQVVEDDASKAVLYDGIAALDTESYRYAEADESVRVTNVMTGYEASDINAFIPGSVTYLTRGGGGNDWSTSFPEPVVLAATDEMIDILNGKTYQKPADAPDKSSFKMGVSSGISFFDMKDEPYDSEKWDIFLDQFTLAELLTIEKDSYGAEAATGDINRPKTTIGDGPDGNMFEYRYGDELVGTCYTNQVVLASTWNIELIRQRGDLLAEDALYSGVQALCAPGANLHRTPYGGRNYEYYSEDSVMTYLYVAEQCAAMQAKGLMAELKHFAANDQETNRNGVATFMTEQRYRQENLKAFEGAFTEGGALGTMGALNRIGCVAMSASNASQNKILREEWGYRGYVITDSSVASKNYIHSVECLVARSDFFCLDSRQNDIRDAINSGDGYVLQCLREANKRFYYAFARSNLVNGLSADYVATATTYWWMSAILAIEIVLGVLACGCLAMHLVGRYVVGRKGEVRQ